MYATATGSSFHPKHEARRNVSTPTDKEIAWQGRIQERAARATAAIMDRLERYPKSGLASMAPADRRDIADLVAREVIDTMMHLGSYVTAGAQDFQVATLEQVTIKGTDKVKLAMVPVAADNKPINLDLLAQNSGKQVVIAFINGVAYHNAREALVVAIHRQQTDWINRDLADQELPSETPPADAGGVVEGSATATVANITAHAEGDLIADQPGEDSGDTSAKEASEQGAAGKGQPDGDGSGGDHSGARADAGASAENAGEGSQGPDPGDDVPPPPPATAPAKRRRGGRPWAGHH